MRLMLSADHRGAEALKLLADKLRREGHQLMISGDFTSGVSDYPEQAYQVAQAVASGRAEMGILLCGTGIGMSIAANKVAGVRAAVVHDDLTAQIARSHNDSNVLCLSADLLGQRLIEGIVDAWLKTPFDRESGGGRHARRVAKIKAIEEGRDPATAG